jgi:hypothetical protein
MVSIATSPTTPLGNYQVTVVFNETMSAASSFIFLPVLLLPLLFVRRRMTAGRVWFTALLGLALAVGAALGTGCGGSSNNAAGGTSTPPTQQVTTSVVVGLSVN